eukprot:m51a1_g12137 hypothetical protein (1613) ;mRNA; r:69-5044
MRETSCTVRVRGSADARNEVYITDPTETLTGKALTWQVSFGRILAISDETETPRPFLLYFSNVQLLHITFGRGGNAVTFKGDSFRIDYSLNFSGDEESEARSSLDAACTAGSVLVTGALEHIKLGSREPIGPNDTEYSPFYCAHGAVGVATSNRPGHPVRFNIDSAVGPRAPAQHVVAAGQCLVGKRPLDTIDAAMVERMRAARLEVPASRQCNAVFLAGASIDLNIRTGGGADTVDLVGLRVGGHIDARLSTGNDTLRVARTASREAVLDVGAGSDVLVVGDNVSGAVLGVLGNDTDEDEVVVEFSRGGPSIAGKRFGPLSSADPASYLQVEGWTAADRATVRRVEPPAEAGAGGSGEAVRTTPVATVNITFAYARVRYQMGDSAVYSVVGCVPGSSLGFFGEEAANATLRAYDAVVQLHVDPRVAICTPTVSSTSAGSNVSVELRFPEGLGAIPTPVAVQYGRQEDGTLEGRISNGVVAVATAGVEVFQVAVPEEYNETGAVVVTSSPTARAPDRSSGVVFASVPNEGWTVDVLHPLRGGLLVGGTVRVSATGFTPGGSLMLYDADAVLAAAENSTVDFVEGCTSIEVRGEYHGNARLDSWVARKASALGIGVRDDYLVGCNAVLMETRSLVIDAADVGLSRMGAQTAGSVVVTHPRTAVTLERDFGDSTRVWRSVVVQGSRLSVELDGDSFVVVHNSTRGTTALKSPSMTPSTRVSALPVNGTTPPGRPFHHWDLGLTSTATLDDFYGALSFFCDSFSGTVSSAAVIGGGMAPQITVDAGLEVELNVSLVEVETDNDSESGNSSDGSSSPSRSSETSARSNATTGRAVRQAAGNNATNVTVASARTCNGCCFSFDSPEVPVVAVDWAATAPVRLGDRLRHASGQPLDGDCAVAGALYRGPGGTWTSAWVTASNATRASIGIFFLNASALWMRPLEAEEAVLATTLGSSVLLSIECPASGVRSCATMLLTGTAEQRCPEGTFVDPLTGAQPSCPLPQTPSSSGAAESSSGGAVVGEGVSVVRLSFGPPSTARVEDGLTQRMAFAWGGRTRRVTVSAADGSRSLVSIAGRLSAQLDLGVAPEAAVALDVSQESSSSVVFHGLAAGGFDATARSFTAGRSTSRSECFDPCAQCNGHAFAAATVYDQTCRTRDWEDRCAGTSRIGVAAGPGMPVYCGAPEWARANGSCSFTLNHRTVVGPLQPSVGGVRGFVVLTAAASIAGTLVCACSLAAVVLLRAHKVATPQFAVRAWCSSVWHEAAWDPYSWRSVVVTACLATAVERDGNWDRSWSRDTVTLTSEARLFVLSWFQDCQHSALRGASAAVCLFLVLSAAGAALHAAALVLRKRLKKTAWGGRAQVALRVLFLVDVVLLPSAAFSLPFLSARSAQGWVALVGIALFACSVPLSASKSSRTGQRLAAALFPAVPLALVPVLCVVAGSGVGRDALCAVAAVLLAAMAAVGAAHALWWRGRDGPALVALAARLLADGLGLAFVALLWSRRDSGHAALAVWVVWVWLPPLVGAVPLAVSMHAWLAAAAKDNASVSYPWQISVRNGPKLAASDPSAVEAQQEQRAAAERLKRQLEKAPAPPPPAPAPAPRPKPTRDAALSSIRARP